ncbi:MAG: hypothetical protein IKE27_07700 [Oscillospiraceae bacterium]|nr:hypothetical protein [Oscillospiraceae bacterium]
MKCPTCGGFLHFDIKSQMLKCNYCSNVFDPSEYDRDNGAQASLFEDSKIYICTHCGAELYSMSENAAVYCSYCGSEAILSDRLQGDHKPQLIIPFKFTKRRCINAYKKKIDNLLYVPDELKDPKFIEKFRGIYIPYWMYNIKFRKEPIEFQAHKNYTSGGYDYRDKYRIVTQLDENGMYGFPNDASRNFDDKLSSNIAPYHSKDLREYKDGYLAGFYADAPNVESHIYTEDVVDMATEAAFDNIERQFGDVDIDLSGGIEAKKEALGTRFFSSNTVFLPVWFLTWKKKDRVAYSVVNGQTGKLHMDVPVDFRKFFLTTGVIAAIIFAILTLLFTPTSRFVLWFSTLILYLISRSFMKELREIRNRENHVFDKGYLLTGEPEDISMSQKKAERIRENKKSGLSSAIKSCLASSVFMIMFMSLVSGLLIPLIGIAYDLMTSQYVTKVVTAFFTILNVVVFFKSYAAISYIKKKSSLVTILLSLIASLMCTVVAITAPVADIWYYSGGIFCLFASVVIAVDLISRYNELSTRAVPSFITRTGGKDNASDY